MMSHAMLNSREQERLNPEEGYGSEEYDEEEADSDDSESIAQKREEGEKEFSFEPEPPDEGVYGMAVASIILDYRNWLLARGDPERKCRYATRLFLALLLTSLTIGLQGYLTIMTKLIVTPNAVKAVREAYSEFQIYMYDGHVYNLSTGYYRGIDKQFFNISKLSSYGIDHADQMENLCTSPLAQSHFLFAILLVWTTTCLAYFRQSLSFTYRLLSLNNCRSMTSSTVMKKYSSDDEATHIVESVTIGVKIFMVVFVQVPVLGMNLFLLWIGGRWLTATLGFDELLLNAIALEFVLNLHTIFYKAVVPISMKLSLGSILVPHAGKRSEKPNWWNMISAFGLIIVAVSWVFLYMLVFQQVLPEYRWDIEDSCRMFDSGEGRSGKGSFAPTPAE